MIRIKELSSLEELLRQAGYKDTRVCTPEAEKVRKIKQTFEDDEAEELNDLYGTFGLKRQPSSRPALEHRIQNVTEPSVPFRSSSAMLRDLALQNAKQTDRETTPSSPPVEGSSWWEGGMAAIGRAAKAVIEKSPPPGDPRSDRGLAVDSPTAKASDGLRKTKSNMELRSGQSPRSSTLSREQRPPSPPAPPVQCMPEPSGMITDFVDERDMVNTYHPASQAVFDDEVYGYRPLPSEYEAEDDTFHATSFEVGSLGSSEGRPSEDHGDDAEDIADVHAIDNDLHLFASGSEDLSDGVGRRVMQGARDYDDEFDSPPRLSSPLPEVDTSVAHEVRLGSQAPSLPATAPSLKYSDRATKLRIAKSTPQLKTVKPQASWFGSLRQAIMGPAPTEQEPTATTSTSRAPGLRITPAAVAAPSLVTTSTVLCDSASNGAIDLPPVQMRAAKPPTTYETLRLRPSLARLRQAVFPEPTVSEDATPTLSPRLEWDNQGEQFAGWGWSTKKPRPQGGRIPDVAAHATEAEDPVKPKGSIDYSKSFFYKPETPPRKDTGTAATRPTPARSSTQPQLRTRRSEKSLRAALLLPVAAPPVPAIPSRYSLLRPSSAITPPRRNSLSRLDPPVLAIQSPGSWEAGLPPRALVLEGEEWDARDGNVPGDWGRKAVRKSGSKKLKKPEPIC